MSTSKGRWEFDQDGNVRYVEEGGTQPTTDGAYHYSYRQQDQSQSGSRNTTPPHRSKSDDSWHWALIVLGFVAAWPIGVILLILQLAGKWPGSRELGQEARRVSNAVQRGVNQAREAARNQQAARSQQAAQTAQTGSYGQTTSQVQERLEREKAERAEKAREQARKAQEQREQKAAARQKKKEEADEGLPFGLGHVKLFRWIGGIMAGAFGLGFVFELLDDLSYGFSALDVMRETVPLLALALIGVTLIAMAGSRKRKLKKFQKYLSMIGKREVVSISSLAEAMGVSEKQAEKDLEEMLDRSFWEEGYVDASRRALVLSGPLEEPAPEPEPVPEDEDENAGTLRHIRQVNDAIADPDMSAKIAHIEELTAKIFKLLEEKPEKAKELRGFMNYYLPETLKILENYAKLEAQGISGDNITEAKAKIEGMMDKLVDGYETQLDKLFADDVMDISADLKVMEDMLAKDGLTATEELRF